MGAHRRAGRRRDAHRGICHYCDRHALIVHPLERADRPDPRGGEVNRGLTCWGAAAQPHSRPGTVPTHAFRRACMSTPCIPLHHHAHQILGPAHHASSIHPHPGIPSPHRLVDRILCSNASRTRRSSAKFIHVSSSPPRLPSPILCLLRHHHQQPAFWDPVHSLLSFHLHEWNSPVWSSFSRLKRISQEGDMMSTQGGVLLVVFAVLLLWDVASATTAPPNAYKYGAVAPVTNLVPPKGYSVGFTAVTVDGSLKYDCTNGAWSNRGSIADLKAADGTDLGSYWSVYNKETRVIDYYWSIINSDGTRYESGAPISGLQALLVKSVEVSTSAVADYLAIITIHRYAGDASQVAFVSLTGTQGGLPPRQELCTSPSATADVPFSGNFTFYNQDLEPPADLPASLTPMGADFVQVVFLEGKIMYKFTKAGQWRYRGIFATVRDVAGGNILGKFGTVKEPDASGSKLLFQFKDPNGFSLSVQKASKPIQMSADGIGWQLLKVTSSSGTVSPLGKFTYVLIGGTMGGLAPRIAGRTYGMTWGSPFTAQCYLYTG